MSVSELPPTYCPCGHPVPIRWNDGGECGGRPNCNGCGRPFRREDGICILETAAVEEDFPPESFAAHHDIERTHFWSRSRNLVIRSMLRRIPDVGRPKVFLDIGCGTGSVSAWVRSLGYQTVGLDMWLDALKYASRRSRAPTVCCNALSMPFRGAFDVVGLFDVIEHVTDDVALLRAAARALKPGGYVLVTVPADRRLWSPYDEVFGHKRRYRRQELISVLRQAGFVVDRASYYNTLLWPVQYLYRRWQRARGIPQRPRAEITRALLKVPPAPINAVLRAVMSAESLWVGRYEGRFGSALIALARRVDATPPPARSTRGSAAARSRSLKP